MNQAPAQVPVRVGVLSTMEAADTAIHHLLEAGFTRKEIGVVCSEANIERHYREFEKQSPAGTWTPLLATAGGVVGAAVGGLSVVAGAAIGGNSSLLATGGIAAWAGGVLGGLVGAMISRGFEPEVANYYDQAVQDGKILVTIEDHGPHHEQRLLKAEEILRSAGADPLRLPEG